MRNVLKFDLTATTMFSNFPTHHYMPVSTISNTLLEPITTCSSVDIFQQPMLYHRKQVCLLYQQQQMLNFA